VAVDHAEGGDHAGAREVGRAELERQTLSFDGQSIVLLRPAGFTDTSTEKDTRRLPSNELLAQALSGLPPVLRTLVTEVRLYEAGNPNDAHWDKIYNPDNIEAKRFKSQFTADIDGRISGFPAGSAWTLGKLDGYMAHETGHTYSFRMMGADTASAGWADWREAMAQDRFAASGYARHTVAEDFSEFLEMYLDVRGTPEASELAKIFPRRTAALEALFARPLPPR
jgi:hypothetical protein